jgi:sugar lactone lactonase YvrE
MQIALARRARLALALLALAGGAAVALLAASSSDTSAAVRSGPPAFHGSWVTVAKTAFGLEGLTGDRNGFLYSPGRGADPCPIVRVSATGGPVATVGTIPAPCNPAGLAFDAGGKLYVADGDRIVVLTPSAASPPTATVFATGVPGANGLAFDARGNLWVSDGGTAQGRVWRIGAAGIPAEAFRVQPTTNEVNLVGDVGGVGRDQRSLPPGTVTITPTSRQAANLLGSQHIVANGLAFDRKGTILYVADTARGAIWRVELDRQGNVLSPTGCDTTFAANTLCLDNVLVAHPFLEGVDGIALDRAGNIWGAANERNAVAVVTPRGVVLEYFRNAPAASQLRNEGPLEFPTSPFLLDRTLCLTHSDGSRRDNFPNTAGEVTPAGPDRAKISCVDRTLASPGLPLPVG